MKLLLSCTFDIKELANVLVGHQDLSICARSTGLHEDTMPLMITMVIMEILAKKIFHTGLRDSADNNHMWHT